MYALVLIVGFSLSSHALPKKAIVEISRDPLVRAELSLNELGVLSVVQIDEHGAAINKPASVTTRSLRFWQKLNRDDTEQTQNFFIKDNRVFAITFPYQEVAPRYGMHESRLHEFKFVQGRTKSGKFGIVLAFSGTAIWSLPVLMVAQGLMFGNPTTWAAAQHWFAQVGAVAYLGSVAGAGVFCRRALSDTRGVFPVPRMTPVMVEGEPAHVAQIIGDVAGKVDDVIYKTQSGKTGSLSRLIDQTSN